MMCHVFLLLNCNLTKTHYKNKCITQFTSQPIHITGSQQKGCIQNIAGTIVDSFSSDQSVTVPASSKSILCVEICTKELVCETLLNPKFI